MSDSPKSFDDVIDMLTHDCHVYALEVARLKAENARLRKAGDEILKGWQSNSGGDVERFTKAYWLWITAKEGKPIV